MHRNVDVETGEKVEGLAADHPIASASGLRQPPPPSPMSAGGLRSVGVVRVYRERQRRRRTDVPCLRSCSRFVSVFVSP